MDGGLMPASAFIQHRGSGPNPRRQEGPHAHCATFSPDGRFLLVADLGVDRVFVYRVDPVHGELAPNDPPWVELPPGSGPRHVAFAPDGRRVFVVNELACTLASFAWDGEAGRLEPLDSQSTLPAGFTGRNTCAEVAVHPNGRFVYASNRGHDSLAVFAIGPEGRLRLVDHTPTGGRTPRHFALDPEGRWLWAANQDSGNIVLFRVDPKTGRLQPAGRSLSVPRPVCVLFAPVEATAE
ncbi:MAG: lactonase family protein [Verrucomicrobia bacterium]|nr:MAG: lactonase family protein [Verrucomicrobiota bacterium]